MRCDLQASHAASSKKIELSLVSNLGFIGCHTSYSGGDTDMSNNEQAIEQEIQDKGLTAPRLTPALIDAAIKNEDYHVFGETCLTVCCLTLTNGFTVTGESACASPENFNAEIGRKIAKDNARNKIWMLEGYLLKQRLFEAKNPMPHAILG